MSDYADLCSYLTTQIAGLNARFSEMEEVMSELSKQFEAFKEQYGE